jgi:L-lactate dehydrogenase complex protein LldG
MSAAREQMLGHLRRALGRDAPDPAQQAALEARLASHPRNLVPARAQIPHPQQIELFVALAERAAATVVRVQSADTVPAAVADFLAAQNLPARIKLAPDPALDALPWTNRPLLQIERGIAAATDTASVTAAIAGVAETGTLMLISGPQSPTTLNFLPDNNIVLLRARQVVGPFEEAWDRLRAMQPPGAFPRTVNFITGPSRSADIEQRLQMGAHGPRRLHIILVEGDDGEKEG